MNRRLLALVILIVALLIPYSVNAQTTVLHNEWVDGDMNYKNVYQLDSGGDYQWTGWVQYSAWCDSGGCFGDYDMDSWRVVIPEGFKISHLTLTMEHFPGVSGAYRSYSNFRSIDNSSFIYRYVYDSFSQPYDLQSGMYNLNVLYPSHTVARGARWTITVTVESVDTTPPVITPAISGVPGSNGWYTGDVTLSWLVDDPDSTAIPEGCNTTVVTTDTVGTMFTCSASSAGGTASESVTIKRDATAPEVAAVANGALGDNGWYISAVTVDFNGNDVMSGIVSCSGDVVLTGDGANQPVGGECVDGAGNIGFASTVVSIDQTAPVAIINGVTTIKEWESTTLISGSYDATSGIASVNFSPNSTISGIDGPAIIPVTLTVVDNAGNSATASTVVTVLSPQQVIEEVLVTIEGLLGDDAQPLAVTLTQATNSLNEGRLRPAHNQLNAFINQLNALVNSDRLDANTVQQIIDEVNLLNSSF